MGGEDSGRAAPPLGRDELGEGPGPEEAWLSAEAVPVPSLAPDSLAEGLRAGDLTSHSASLSRQRTEGCRTLPGSR